MHWIQTPQAIRDFALMLSIAFGAETWVVGGACRDTVLGDTPHDIDIEITGLSEYNLTHLPFAQVIPGGDRFGVWIVTFHDETFEVALPQTRERVGDGHSGEIAHIDPNLPIEQSLARRDFTANAIAWNVLTEEIVDPFDGIDDIHTGILRAVNAGNFADDPLRVLRGVQLASRTGLVPDCPTVSAAQAQIGGFSALSSDRVRQEWVKWAQGSTPALGIKFLVECGWIECFPSLNALRETEQDPIWHPEGDALTHTIFALEVQPSCDPIINWAILLHDIAKPHCTATREDGRIISPGHDQLGADMIPDVLREFGFEIHGRIPEWVQAVQAIVREHMWAASLSGAPGHRGVRRLARRLAPATVRQWGAVCLADVGGRAIARSERNSLIDTILDVAEDATSLGIVDDGPAKIVTGKLLIEHDIIEPGIAMGKLIDLLFELQLDGWFTDEEIGLQFARELVENVQL